MLEQIGNIQPRFMSFIISTKDFTLYMQYAAVMLLISVTLQPRTHLIKIYMQEILYSYVKIYWQASHYGRLEGLMILNPSIQPFLRVW